MFLRICSRNQLRQGISFMQRSVNNPFHSTGYLATVKRDFYSDLKVPRNAIQREINEAYQNYSKLYKTELAAGVKDAAEKLKRLHQAYYVLGNAERKRLYDKGLTTFSKNLPQVAPVISDEKKNTPAVDQEPIPVTEKSIKEYLDKQLGDMKDIVSYKERKIALDVATDLYLTGDTQLDEPSLYPSKAPETYTERALRKLAQKGKIIAK